MRQVRTQEVSPLGPFESEVMDTIWSRGECTVRDVLAALAGAPAYTTVMTTMDRLHRKGLLDRRPVGRAFVYAARLTRDGFAAHRASGVFGGLLQDSSAAEPVLSCFVDAVGARDEALLDTLEELIRRKRGER